MCHFGKDFFWHLICPVKSVAALRKGFPTAASVKYDYKTEKDATDFLYDRYGWQNLEVKYHK